jgi:hypothetical protein
MLIISLGAPRSFEIAQLKILCTPFLIELFESLESNFLSSLYILDISPLSNLGKNGHIAESKLLIQCNSIKFPTQLLTELEKAI